jgi:hypothetical protein
MKTKKGTTCSIHADRYVDGKAYCHLHDPNGTFQQDLQADRFIKNAESVQKPPRQQSFGDIITLNGTRYQRIE